MRRSQRVADLWQRAAERLAHSVASTIDNRVEAMPVLMNSLPARLFCVYAGMH